MGGGASMLNDYPEVSSKIYEELKRSFHAETQTAKERSIELSITEFPADLMACKKYETAGYFSPQASMQCDGREEAPYESLLIHRLQQKHEDLVTRYTPIVLETPLRQINDAIDTSIYAHERWPIIVDAEEQVLRFFKYQRATTVHLEDPLQTQHVYLRKKLVEALRSGTAIVLSIPVSVTEAENAPNVFEKVTSLFDEDHFPEAVLQKQQLFKLETLEKILRPEEDQLTLNQFFPRDDFQFVIILALASSSSNESSSQTESNALKMESFQKVAFRFALRLGMSIINLENSSQPKSRSGEVGDLEAALGYRELQRNSLKLVEAGFEGNWDMIEDELEKGYSLESSDAHGHTALSEAACSGNLEVVEKLLSLGAEVNVQNDIGRTPLFRASFNNHHSVVEVLLKNGGDSRLCAGMEGPLDVAKSATLRKLLEEWDLEETDKLVQHRKIEREKAKEAILTNAAEREAYARDKIRQELVEIVNQGNDIQLRERLEELINEAIVNNERTRGSAEARDENGQTLLLLAVCKGNLQLVTFLLTHHKTFDEDFETLEKKTFFCNVKARNNKGWNACSLAVFHEQPNILLLLLQEGCNPNIKNSYHKNAFDFALDEKDAAHKVTNDRSELRNILLKWEEEQHPILAQQRKLERTEENNLEAAITAQARDTTAARKADKSKHQKQASFGQPSKPKCKGVKKSCKKPEPVHRKIKRP